MSNTSNASKNVKRFLLLFALGIAYGFMYVMPYMKSSFYDQMIAAMGCTTAQLGYLMTAYCICCTVSYLPGGWSGDKFNPKPVLLISIFGQAALSFLFMFTYKSYTMAVIIWLLMGLPGGFAFWPAIMKGIRMTGTAEEQGRMYGIFEALNGLASLLLSFIMIGVMAVVGGSDLITGFKSALAFMGGLSIVSGILVAILMPKDAAYGVSDEEKENQKKITFKDYVSAFKIPGVWIMAILVWCYVTISAVASYLTPYSTGVLGMSATLAATIGTFRTYGCRLIGGPLGGYLADGLQEGLGLNVAHGAADLRDDRVHVLFRHGVDAALDLVGDVGDDLHRGAQVVAPALPVQHGPVDLAGGHGAVAGEVLVHEPLVVAQVQVRLGSVLGDEHLAVLIGTHSPRVHIDIGVELLVPHPDAPLLQKPPQGGRADPLAQAGDHAAGNEYEFR